MRRALLASIVIAAVAGPVSVAQASNITVDHIVPTCTGGDECRYFMEPGYDNFTLTGAPGEVNRITVTGNGQFPGPIRFRDDGAPIADPGNCARIDEHEVLCTGRIGSVDGGDMNDVITSDGINVSGAGGAGDDELIGGAGSDRLSGGPGQDVLRGNDGFDVLLDGHDGGAADADVFEGGPGGARVSYIVSTAGVAVDLADPSATQGEPNEGDRLSGITAVEGSTGHDTLAAAPGGSALDGSLGNDVLIGGAGDDTLDGSLGRNTIMAGDGDDKIGSELAIASQSRVSCGDGVDTIELPSRRDLVGPDCDTVVFYSDLAAASLPLSSITRPVVRAGEFSCYESGRPNLELRVAATYRRRGLPRAGTLLGRRTATRRACSGRNSTLSVRLSATGRRLLRRHRRLPVQVRINDPGNEARYVTELIAP